jgi:hypothetical protein
MASSQISNFTSGGKAVAGVTRAGVKPSQLGVLVEGRLYQKPRARLTDMTGNSVRVVNPAALDFQQVRRNASLGMGGVGSFPRNRAS